MQIFESKIRALEFAEKNSYLAEFYSDNNGMLHGWRNGQVIPFTIKSTSEKENKYKHIIISLSGKAQSGKNTTADFIKKICLEMGSIYKVHEFSFAERLKQIAKDQFNWDGSKEVCPSEITNKGRNLLINIGNAYRSIDRDYWINIVIKQQIEFIKSVHEPKYNLFVGTDTRYANEILSLRKLEEDYKEDNIKVYCIKVERNQSLHIDNISEKDLDSFYCWDKTLVNNGSLGDLKKDITYTLTKWGVV